MYLQSCIEGVIKSIFFLFSLSEEKNSNSSLSNSIIIIIIIILLVLFYYCLFYRNSMRLTEFLSIPDVQYFIKCFS